MPLITAEQRAALLANGAESAKRDIDPHPVVKLFTPDAGPTWLLTELDREAHAGRVRARQPGLGLTAMTTLPAIIDPEMQQTPASPPAQADDDAQMIRLWLARSSSANTRRNYEREARRFLAHVGKPLGSVRMGDLQDYIAARRGSSATKALTAAALKSLFAFAQEVGYLRFNIGAAVKVPPIKNTLAERTQDAQ
ncbi:DUF2958 domain-containing protein [Methylobacterium phyllosphaerae]